MHHNTKPLIVDYEDALKSMETFQDFTADRAMQIALLAEQYALRRTTESIKAVKIMSAPVFTVMQDTIMSEAAHLLVTNRISGLPVVGEDNSLLGIVTEADFLDALGIPVNHPHDSVWQTLETMISHASNVNLMNMKDGIVKDYMTTNVVSATPDNDIRDIVDLMKRHKVKRVVISDQKCVVGMVTRSDLVKIFFDRVNIHK